MQTVNSYLKNKEKNKNNTNNNKSNYRMKTLNEIAKLNDIDLSDLEMKFNAAQEQKKKETSWFQSSSAFDDGYQAGDVIKTIGASIGDMATHVSKAFISTVESAADTGQYLLADIASGLSNVKALDVWDKDARVWLKEKADSLKENAKVSSTGAIYGENETDNLFKKGWTTSLEENSVLGNTLDTINEGIGQVGAMVGLSYLGSSALGAGAETMGVANTAANAKRIQTAASALSSFSSGYGSARSEAYKNGANDEDSIKAGMISGVAEAISEQLFEGIPGMKVEGWGSKVTGKIAGKLEKSFGTTTGKLFLKVADAAGEGFEEIISNLLTTTGTYITDKISGYEYGMKDKSGNFGEDILNDLTSEESWKSFFSAAMTSALISGGNTILTTAQKNTIIKKYAEENNISVKEAKSMFENTVNAQTNDIAGNENFADKMEARDEIVRQELNNMKNNVFVEKNLPNNIEINSNLQNNKTNLPTNEDITTKGMSFEDSAKYYGIDINSSSINNISNLLKNRGIDGRFDSTMFNNENEISLWKITSDENGNIKREVVYNPKANEKAIIEDATIHEMYHDIIGTKQGQEIKKSIIDHISSMEEYQQARKDLIKKYTSLTDENGNQIYNVDSPEFNDLIDEEATASVLGAKLGNQEFINDLIKTKQSLAKRIYNWVVEKLNNITNGKIEKLYWENIKNKFEIAYRKEYKQSNKETDTKYSTIGAKGAKNLSKNSTQERYNNLYVLLKTAKEIAKSSTNNFENTNIETKKQTQWFQTKYGDWATIISDKDSKLIKNLEPNKTYRLGDILKHDLLYKAYPGLENLKVKTVDSIKTTGAFETIKGIPTNTLTTDILLRNSDISKKDFRKTILHEVNHFIEGYERFNKNSRGANRANMTIDEYRNNLGEIISNETKILADLTQEKLDNIILFEQGKANPQDKNIRKAIDLSNNLDKRSGRNNNINAAGYSRQNQNQMASKNNIQNNSNNRIKNTFYDEELDNSSFSYRGSHQIENANRITDLKLDEIVEKVTEVNGGLSKQDYSDLSKLKKILNSPNETIKIYRASPVNELNNGDWVTTDKSYAKNVADQNGGKVYEYEVKANQLFYPNDVKELPSLHRLSSFQYNNSILEQGDTKYSSKSNEWEDFLNKNIKNDGAKTTFGELRSNTSSAEKVNLPIEGEINLPTIEKMQTTNNDRQKTIDELIKQKIKKTIENESYKAVNMATKTGQNYLDFNRKEKAHFKEQLSKYIGMTRGQLVNAKTINEIKDIVRQYADKEITYIDNEMESVKKEIRNIEIKVTDELKRQITDYNYFRKSNFGKLKLGNSGTNVDVVYQELAEMYPHYFSNTNISEEDMLYELSEFMNQDTTIMEKYKIDENTIEEAAVKVYNKLMKNTMLEEDVTELQQKLEEKYKERTREVVQQELLDDMGITIDDIAKGKDISSIDIARTDPIRLNEKIFGWETGKKINDATINKTKHNEAERIRFLNKERTDIEDLGIKPRSKESAAVQKYGEKQYVDKYGDVKKYGDAELSSEFENVKDQEKIKKAARVIREKYDTYIEQINNVLVEMGYKPIEKRSDYMRHFQALNDVFSRYGVPLNRESLQNDSLPTDINGLTDQFKPGKQYFANALQRMGMKTEYDAITGIDGYLEGASNLIYHTEDIQRYRSLSKLIRNTYGTKNGFENFGNMTEKEQMQRVKDIQSNKLAKYAAWLDEQANALAGKKGKIDRGAEELLGRKIYTFLDTAKKQVGSNMTGFNVRSALTNFASAIQGASKTNKLSFIEGTISTINNIIHKDNLINKSDFLTSRFGSDSLSPKLWQKISNIGQIFMTGTDYFTANQIWRGKYFENIHKGMNENAAIKEADDFAARIMGDRSKGSTATMFNSKTLGFITQFQLEVNNQWSSLIHDNKMDIQSGKKSIGGVAFQLGQLFGLSYLFNGLMKAVTGSDVMIDPIDLFKKLFAPDDDDDKDLEQRAEEALGDIIDDLPFVSFLTGGRIPVSEAFTGVSTAAKKLTGQTDNYGNSYEWSDVGKDMIESAFYWLLPTGYGQIKKTTQGLEMYDENLPIAGSYTNSGRLRYEADTSTFGKIQAALFGRNASKNAREYRDKGYAPLTEKQLNTALEAGLNINEYRKYQKGLKEQDSNEDKINYIYNLPIDDDQKNVLANNTLNRKEKVDLSNYGDYGSLAEFDYANKNPEKYATIIQITDFNSFNNYKEEIASIKEQYSDTNERKKAVFEYINSLELNKYQKLMLQKMAAGYSIKSYKNGMFNYINSLELTAQEKQQIHNELFN